MERDIGQDIIATEKIKQALGLIQICRTAPFRDIRNKRLGKLIGNSDIDLLQLFVGLFLFFGFVFK